MNEEFSIEKCFRLCEAPQYLPGKSTRFQIWKHQRDELVIRCVYLFFISVPDLLKIDLSDIEFDDYIIHLKKPRKMSIERKNVDKGGQLKFEFFEDRIYFDEYTKNLMIRYLDGRKKGQLFISSRNIELSVREVQRIIGFYSSIILNQRFLTPRDLIKSGFQHAEVYYNDLSSSGNKIDLDIEAEIFRKCHPFFRLENSQNSNEFKQLLMKIYYNRLHEVEVIGKE